MAAGLTLIGDVTTRSTRTLTRQDILDLLTGFAASIELDQIRVDALPPEKFHLLYNDGMWRRCRRDHLDYIDRLLSTVDTIASELLEELTWLAITHEAAVVRQAMVNIFAEASSGMCAPEEFQTAELFFGWLIKDACLTAPGRLTGGDARQLMMKWVSVTDPLQIAQDPECGYGRPAGFVN